MNGTMDEASRFTPFLPVRLFNLPPRVASRSLKGCQPLAGG